MATAKRNALTTGGFLQVRPLLPNTKARRSPREPAVPGVWSTALSWESRTGGFNGYEAVLVAKRVSSPRTVVRFAFVPPRTGTPQGPQVPLPRAMLGAGGSGQRFRAGREAGREGEQRRRRPRVRAGRNGDERLLPEAAAEGTTWRWVWEAWEKTSSLPPGIPEDWQAGRSRRVGPRRAAPRRPRPAGAGCRQPPAEARRPAATRGGAFRHAAAASAGGGVGGPRAPPFPKGGVSGLGGPGLGLPPALMEPPAASPPPRGAASPRGARRLPTAGGGRAAAAPAGGEQRRAAPGRPSWAEWAGAAFLRRRAGARRPRAGGAATPRWGGCRRWARSGAARGPNRTVGLGSLSADRGSPRGPRWWELMVLLRKLLF